MTRIGLLSDTHGCFPKQIMEHFANVDEIWHAGDIGTIEVADNLEKMKPLRAVFGNIDGHELRVRYPEINHFTIENMSVYMTHIGGYPPKYNAIVKPQIILHKPHLFICGHSHILKVIPDINLNLLHLNPGACGNAGWHKINTLMRFNVNDNRIQDLEIIEFERGHS